MSELTEQVEVQIRSLFSGMPFAAGTEGANSIIVRKDKGTLTLADVLEALKALQHTLESVADEYNERGKKLMEMAAVRRSIGEFLTAALADAAERKR